MKITGKNKKSLKQGTIILRRNECILELTTGYIDFIGGYFCAEVEITDSGDVKRKGRSETPISANDLVGDEAE